jgi:hypothetical protein
MLLLLAAVSAIARGAAIAYIFSFNTIFHEFTHHFASHSLSQTFKNKFHATMQKK